MSSIAGSRIIVTGGASGMGAAIVRAFAADGVRVASLDINIEQGRAVVAAANDGANGEAAFFACDVADKPNVELAMGEARDWLGGLDDNEILLLGLRLRQRRCLARRPTSIIRNCSSKRISTRS